MDERILLGLLIFIFVLFFILNRVSASKVGIKANIGFLQAYTTEAGLGSLLAGTFFGVVREILLKRPADNKLTMIVMIGFFMWYILTKSLSTLFISAGSKKMAPALDDNTELKNENKSAAIIQKKKLPDLYNVLVSAIIILLVMILLVSFYAQRKEGSDKHIVNYNILITCMVVLAGFFTFLSGKKLDIDLKIKILSYTISFALIFCIFTPIFITKNFSFTNVIISSLIFFVWLTLTFSFSNFTVDKAEYVNRY